MTDPKLTIEQRMLRVMELVERVVKDRKNPHGGYLFIGHDDVTLALRKAFVTAGIVQRVSILEAMRLEGGGLGVRAQVEWVSADDPQQRVTVETYGEAQQMDKKGQGTPQQVGIALSYAVKVAMLKNFALVGDDTPDPEPYDTTDREGLPEPPPREPSAGDVPAVSKLIAGFAALTTVKQYDAIMKRTAGVLGSVSAEERTALTNAAREARARISTIKETEQ